MIRTVFKTGLLAVLLLLSVSAMAGDGSWRGRIMDVIDGDSLVISRKGRPVEIRLDGIDAPEHNQPAGPDAKIWMEQFEDEWVFVRPTGYDRYGRTLANIYLDEKWLNLEMVRAGWAWWYKKYAPDKKALADAETEAKTARQGLWTNPDAKPPWEHRKYK